MLLQSYSELRTRVDGISEKMLVHTLRELRLDGLIVRESYPVVPPHTEYRLSDSGREVAVIVGSLITWIEGHVHELLDVRSCSLQPALENAAEA